MRKLLAILLFLIIVFAGGGAVNTSVPVYYLKVLTLTGTTLAAPDGTLQAAPLPVADLTFSETLYRPGQKNLGEMTATLLDVRDPRYMQYRDLYFQLDYEQRLEVYTSIDCTGTPVWTGVLTRLPNSLDKAQIAGQGILRRLDTRKLRRYHQLTGNASTIASGLRNVYSTILFSDDFNTNSLAQWTLDTDVLVTAAGGIAKIQNDVSQSNMLTASTFTAAQWGNSKIDFDISIPKDTNADIRWWRILAGTESLYLSISKYITANSRNSDDTAFVLWNRNGGTDTSLGTRTLRVPKNEIQHVSIFTEAVATGHRIVITLNDLEVFNLIDTISLGWTHAGALRFQGVMGEIAAVGTDYINIDNVLLTASAAAITAGTFDSTIQNITQIFNNNTQLEALNWIADYMGWEYRVNSAAGAGNDTIDFGASVGTNLSSSITLQEGVNITDMSRDRTSQDLATSLYVYGQVQDDTSANFISTSLAQMAVYGIIEKDYNNPMVVDSGTAKVLGDNRLAVMSAGNVSLSGTAIDESVLFEKASQNRLRAGDTVTLVSSSLNINKTVRIVQVDRTSGTPLVKLTFDYFPYRQTDAFRDLMQQYWDLRRGFINRMNTQNIELVFASQTTQNWYVYLRGQIQAVYIDVRLNSGTPTYAILIDGTDRTNALFGSATLTADAHATDTTYLILSGDHTVGVQVSAGTGTLDLAIQTRILS